MVVCCGGVKRPATAELNNEFRSIIVIIIIRERGRVKKKKEKNNFSAYARVRSFARRIASGFLVGFAPFARLQEIEREGERERDRKR